MSDTWNAGAGGPGQDPGMWARLMGYISPQAPPQPAPGPGGQFQGPGTAQQSGGWPVNAAGQPQYAMNPLKQALASGPGNTNQPSILPHLGGDGPNVQGRPVLPYLDPNTAAIANAASIPTGLPPQGAPPGQGGIGSDANFPVSGAGGFPGTYAAPGQQPPVPGPGPTPLPPVRPKVAGGPSPVRRRPAATIPASATASVPPAAKSPWVTGEAQNQDVVGGALARGGGGRPMGMLDLSKLFARQ